MDQAVGNCIIWVTGYCRVSGSLALTHGSERYRSSQISCIWYDTVLSHFSSSHAYSLTEGLQATAAEVVMPKLPTGKKKGKKSGPRQRQSRITNVHLKGDIDLTKDYVPPNSSH